MLETLADTRRDGGALIAGSREYASVAPAVRSALRRGRVLREVLVFGGGLLPILIFPLSLRAGALRAVSADAAAWLLTVPSLLSLLGAAGFGFIERRAVADARRAARQRHRAGDDPAKLVQPWYASFEATRAGQGMGRGPLRRAWVGRAGGLLFSAATILVALVVIPVWLLGVFGSQFVGLWGRFYWEDRIIAEARPLELPVDSSVSPLHAGRALLQLQGLGIRGFPPSRLPEKPRPPSLPPLPKEWPGSPGDPARWRDLPNPAFVLEQAVRGFTPAQVAWLRTLDAHPVWATVHTVATASAIDYFGARYQLPLPNGIPPRTIAGSYGFWLAGFQRLAWYNTSRAALRLAEHRPEEAERILRETVSLGLRVREEESFEGATVIKEGRRALWQLARLTGRTVPGLAPTDDSATAPLQEPGTDMPAYARASRSPRADLLAAAIDGRRTRLARWDALSNLVFLPCTNVREAVFGADADVVGAFDIALRSFARFPSDSARIEALKRIAMGVLPAVGRPASTSGAGEGVGLFEWAGGTSARILGVPHLARCFDLNYWFSY